MFLVVSLLLGTRDGGRDIGGRLPCCGEMEGLVARIARLRALEIAPAGIDGRTAVFGKLEELAHRDFLRRRLCRAKCACEIRRCNREPTARLARVCGIEQREEYAAVHGAVSTARERLGIAERI